MQYFLMSLFFPRTSYRKVLCAKTALDHTKYAVRFPDKHEATERAKAIVFLEGLNDRLAQSAFLMGPKRTLADMAILPFVRQFANTDRAWFDTQGLAPLTQWLDDFLASQRFRSVMSKYPPWQNGPPPSPRHPWSTPLPRGV